MTNKYETAARRAKAETLADYLQAGGICAADDKFISREHWIALGQAIPLKSVPSTKTCRLAISMLADRETAHIRVCMGEKRETT